jgi:hypothetical protein
MICFEENGTNQILEFGFNKITSQNLLRKITESIDKEILRPDRSSIHLPRGKRYGNSKPYENSY